MLAGGKRRNLYRGAVVSRKNLNYRNPKVFNKRQFKDAGIHFKVSRRGVENTLIVLAILAIIYILFFSKYFQIQDVIVEGNKTIAGEELKTIIPINSNLLTLKTAPIKSDIIARYPQVKQVALFKGLPNAIKIQIVERDGSIIWQSNNQRYLIDPEGVVGRFLALEEATDLPVVADMRNREVKLNDYLVTPDFIAFTTFVNQNFVEATNLKPTSFSIDETSYDLIVTTDSNISVYFDTTASPEFELENLKKILVNYRDKITQYVDLRVEGWGYYK